MEHIRTLKDEEIRITFTPSEVKRAFKYLSTKLDGPIADTVSLDTNNYRGFWSCFSSKEYNYQFTWNEALRFHSYLRFYLERGKKTPLVVTLFQIRTFPVYGLNVKESN